MTHFNNNIDPTKLYTTERIPAFTFVVDGPDATNKKVNESQARRDNAECIIPENSSTSSVHKQQQQQQQQQNEHGDDTTARTVPSGALHIVPSWQPLDANDKPPYSYATLIGHAILSSDHRRLTLSDIYQWITQHYPFYSMAEHGWQNSIRHNLSLNKAFVRIHRSSKTTSGKGSFWTIRAGKELVFIDNLIKRRGPIRKQPVNLPRTLQHRRSSHRLDAAATSDHDSSSPTNTTTNRHINNSHLFTTFRMTPTAPSPSHSTPPSSSSSTTRFGGRSTHRKQSMPELNQRRKPSSTHLEVEDGHESDCDSGVDFGHHAYPKKETWSTFNNTNNNSYRSQLKKAKSTPCLYDDHLYNNGAAMMDYTFETLLSTSSSSSLSSLSSLSTFDIAATDDLSNWTDSMNIVTPPLLEWNPLFPTDAAINLTPGSPALSSCMGMSYQHLLSSTNTDHTLPMLESAASFGHPPSSSPCLPPTTTSANGALYHDHMFVDQLLMSSWPL